MGFGDTERKAYVGMVAALAIGKMDAIVTKVKTKIKAVVYIFVIFFNFFSFFLFWLG